MNKKYISLSAYICNAISCLQIMKKVELFNFCKRKFEWLSESEFEEVVKLLNEEAAITGITDVYVYQTSTCLMPPKRNIDEIMVLVEQSISQHHNQMP